MRLAFSRNILAGTAGVLTFAIYFALGIGIYAGAEAGVQAIENYAIGQALSP